MKSKHSIKKSLLIVEVKKEKREDLKDIIDTIKSFSSCNIFLNALDVTKLIDTLRSTGPFTVFVPTDDVADIITKEEDVKSLLLYHVVSGEIITVTMQQRNREKRTKKLKINFTIL